MYQVTVPSMLPTHPLTRLNRDTYVYRMKPKHMLIEISKFCTHCTDLTLSTDG